MQIQTTPIAGLLIIEPRVFPDERGYFYESYNEKVFMEKTGTHIRFVQDNQARSVKHVLRGLHYQHPPRAQTKLIRVLEGEIWDVVVDLRPDSSTFGKWHGELLTAENKRQFLVPKGFAHGYAVLSETAEVFYKCDDFYSKEDEGGLFYTDPALGIDWKINLQEAIVSEKDLQQPLLKDAVNRF